MMKAKTTAFDALNPSQRRAATFGTPVPEKGVSAGPMLILAGAGTGKTNTIAHRTAHLVLNGTDPLVISKMAVVEVSSAIVRRARAAARRPGACLGAGLGDVQRGLPSLHPEPVG